MSQIVTDIVIRKTFVDGDDWIRVTFDPRPLSPPAAGQS
jgi:hypothetical protein